MTLVTQPKHSLGHLTAYPPHLRFDHSSSYPLCTKRFDTLRIYTWLINAQKYRLIDVEIFSNSWNWKISCNVKKLNYIISIRNNLEQEVRNLFILIIPNPIYMILNQSFLTCLSNKGFDNFLWSVRTFTKVPPLNENLKKLIILVHFLSWKTGWLLNAYQTHNNFEICYYLQCSKQFIHLK